MLLVILLFVLLFAQNKRKYHSISSPPYSITLCAKLSRARNAKKPDWVVKKIIQMSAWMPHASLRFIAAEFNRLYTVQGMTLCKSTVDKIIKKHKHEIVQRRQRWRDNPPGMSAINKVWGLDLTAKGDHDGHIHYIFGIIDHGSRRALCLRHVLRKNSLTLLGHLLIAIGEFGFPKTIKTDNERVFTSRLFTGALKTLGVRHRLSVKGCPWMNGRIERLFGTLKQTLDLLAIANAAELTLLLSPFVLWYNAIRPHQHLAGRTPLEAWHNIDPNTAAFKEIIPFSALDGRLCGYYVRR